MSIQAYQKELIVLKNGFVLFPNAQLNTDNNKAHSKAITKCLIKLHFKIFLLIKR